MKQFYDVYADQPKLAALLRVLPWTHNLMIMGQNKRPEEREFYLSLAVKAKWSISNCVPRQELFVFSQP
jgi:hypothetical protein